MDFRPTVRQEVRAEIMFSVCTPANFSSYSFYLPFLSMHSWYTNTSVSAKDVTQILLGKAFFDFNSGVTVTTNILFEFYHALCSAKEIIDKIIDRTNNRVSLN